MTATTPASVAGGDRWVLAFQRVADASIAVSVTRRCPVGCDHCITSSTRSPEHGLLSDRLASRWASEMPALAAAGLRHLTFTGGEPTLAPIAVEALADAARAAGIETAIVSSGSFGVTPRAASRMVRRLDAVDRWDLGFDDYHRPAVPFEVFGHVVDALVEAGKPFCVRVCDSPTEQRTMEVRREVVDRVPPGTPVISQPVRALGRAAGRPVPVALGATAPSGRGRGQRRPPSSVCISSGMQVADTGTVAPCCAGLTNADPAHHPFRLDPAGEGLLAAWRSWHEDTLLRTIRLLGFGPVLAWLEEDAYDAVAVEAADDVCEFCVRLWSDPIAQAVARRRADRPGWDGALDRIAVELGKRY